MRVRVNGKEMDLTLAHAREQTQPVEVLDGRREWRSLDKIYPRLLEKDGEIGI